MNLFPFGWNVYSVSFFFVGSFVEVDQTRNEGRLKISLQIHFQIHLQIRPEIRLMKTTRQVRLKADTCVTLWKQYRLIKYSWLI